MVVSGLDLSEEAQDVLRKIIELSKKTPGEAVAEGLALALLYEQTKQHKGRFLVERGSRTEVIEVP